MGVCLLAFLPFKDTFRRERSLTYQLVLRRVQAQQEAARRSQTSSMSHVTVVERDEDGTILQPMTSEAKVAEGDGKKEGQRVTFQDAEAQGSPPDLKEVKLSLKDVNPIPPMWAVLRRLNNLAILFASGESLFNIAWSADAYASLRHNIRRHLQHYLYLFYLFERRLSP